LSTIQSYIVAYIYLAAQNRVFCILPILQSQPAEDSQPVQEAEQYSNTAAEDSNSNIAIEDSNSNTVLEDSNSNTAAESNKAEEVCSSTASQEQNYNSGLEDKGNNKSIQILTPSICKGTSYCSRRYYSYFLQDIYPLPDNKPQQDT
jgi:Flp pilus assembly secretin CpaC